VGLQLTKRARRTAYGVMLGSSVMLLGACSAETQAQADRWAMPATSPATEQAVHIAELWKWAWVAALLTGAVVWGLIFYASWRFRRRSEDEIPVQTRYNLPLEVFYTIFPIIMVVVFFYWTVTVQGRIGIGNDRVDNPDHVVEVVGQQWSWTFNYVNEDAVDSPVVFTAGTGSHIPTLVLPVGQVTEFKLSSPDVIHSFWIPGFLIKMDVIPGQTGDDRNSFQVTPTKTGTFMGKCTELCGVSHSRMLFNVMVVTQAEFEDNLRTLEDQGYTADTPLYGGADARTQVGLNETGGPE
jgi:cytochrome c oxidase subunit 2